MFGLFKKAPSPEEAENYCRSLVENATIFPYMEEGNYVAFIVTVDGKASTVEMYLKHEAGMGAMVAAVEERLRLGQFNKRSDEMLDEIRRATGWKANMSGKRIVADRNNRPIFAWDKETSDDNVEHDNHEALRRRAINGEAEAQRKLGQACAHGHGGVAKDATEAAAWYRKAADQGDARAQLLLGFAYGDGTGVPKDYVERAKWFRKAAEQGFTAAQTVLAQQYHHGRGVPQDLPEAYFWYALSGKGAGHVNADSIRAQLSPAQIAQVQARVSEWKRVRCK